MTNDVSPSLKTQNLLKKRARQRQLLAMMGIDVWVGHDTLTQVVDYDALSLNSLDPSEHPVAIALPVPSEDSVLSSGVSSEAKNAPVINRSIVSDLKTDSVAPVQSASDSKTTSMPVSHSDDSVPANDSRNLEPQNDVHNLATHFRSESQPHQYDDNSQAADINQASTAAHTQQCSQQVLPFELYGALYNNVVILVDGNKLTVPDIALLWQNIVSGLSLSVQSLRFPICEEITDSLAAQASIDGFVFSLARNNTARVVSLTAMPQGTLLKNRVGAPQLSDMLINASEKRRLWQLLTATH